LRARYDESETIDTREVEPDKLFAEYVPGMLYKYHGINKFLFKLLSENKLWFSRPDRFNDPFDCSVQFDFGATQAQAQKSLENIIRITEGDGFGQLFEKFRLQHIEPGGINALLNLAFQTFYNERLSICCFSEVASSILMWSHYANQHKGVCLGFQVQDGNLLQRKIIPVNYYENYPVVKIYEYADTFFSLLMQNIASKARDWDYEYEWRAVMTGKEGLYEFDKTDLQQVIFGANTTKANENRVLKALVNNGYEHVYVSKIVLKENKYELGFQAYEFE